MLKPYLDSSAIVKRYVTEPGSSAVDFIFDKSEAGEIHMVTSIWNIGEVLEVLDEHQRRGWLDQDEFRRTLENFAREIMKLLRLKVLEVVPVLTPILTEAWSLVLSDHIYEADALQIQTRIHSDGVLLSGDKSLINTASRYINAVSVEDENRVRDLFRKT